MPANQVAADARRHILPQTLSERAVLAAAPSRIAGLVVRIAPEIDVVVVVPAVAARSDVIVRRLARCKATLGLVAQHRDELGAKVGLAAQRLV